MLSAQGGQAASELPAAETGKETPPMKGEKFLRVMVIMLCCVVASYIVLSVVRTPASGFSTYKAVRYEVGDGITTSGFVVRSEYLVEGGQEGILVFTRSEGERVGKGQSIARVYRDTEARQRQDQIDRKEEELAQMEHAYSFAAGDVESATLDSDILQLMNQVTVCSAGRAFSQAAAASDQLKTYVLRRYISSTDNEALLNRIMDLKEELNNLHALVEGETETVYAPVSGYFSAVTDGWEGELTPEFLELASTDKLQKYVKAQAPQSRGIAKLVTSPKWYYVTLVDSSVTVTMREGDQLNVRFDSDFLQPVSMNVERITAAQEGKTGLILSSKKYIQNAVSNRNQTAELIFDNQSGLQVPKAAIYVDENGESGVYVLEGAEARWKAVHILYDNGESFLVELDKTSTENLWPEDEIILTTDTIFEGKVMIQ